MRRIPNQRPMVHATRLIQPITTHRATLATLVKPFYVSPTNQDLLNMPTSARKKKGYIKLTMILPLKSMKKILTRKTLTLPIRAMINYKTILWE